MASMRVWCQKVFAALITYTTMTALHYHSIRFRIKTNTAFFLGKTDTHIGYWIMIKLCLLPHCHHFSVAFLSIIFRVRLSYDFFIIKLPIIHGDKLPMMLFICNFRFFSLIFRFAVFKFKKFILCLLSHLRLFSTMILVFLFVHLLHWVNQWKFLEVTFEIWLRFVPFMAPSNFCLLQILNQLSFQYLLLFLLPALLEVRASKFFLN